MVARKSKSSGKAHVFGGDWTSTKLAIIGDYLSRYTTALKDQPFTKAYIDAFAGTGYRAEAGSDDGALVFPALADEGPRRLLDGSARIALKTEPRFDKYIFIEKDAARCEQLEALKGEFPDLAPDIDVQLGDANDRLQTLCSKEWRSRRAVLFLDPYGLGVKWSTIEAIARTHAIDLWLLFPLGMGVNRMLPKSGKVPDAWRKRLDELLGTTEWFTEFYRRQSRKNLFGEIEEETVKTATMETIGRWFVRRLASVFPGVAQQPAVLSNSTNCPLYLLCFAASNERGATVALRIANAILRKVR